ncbi:MAG: hypothetical protein NTV95_04105 [Candidatus Saccharibacteria bacterium]|nr:hypothetical protein [Candidatus Saccharibacteria bacterium]
MNTLELEKRPEASVEENAIFGMELDFDLNAAFQGAISGVASDAELALDEKVRRMESIINEGNSDTYRDFVDFRQIASQMQMICSHDHALGQMMNANDSLSSILGKHDDNDGHNHSSHSHDEDDDDDDNNKKKKSKSSKRRGWFSYFAK